jgi:hypothetical protein
MVQSLHMRRRWFVANNPVWRSRTRSWKPHGTPPKEAAEDRAIHKKIQITAAFRVLYKVSGHQQGQSFRQAEKTATIRPGSEFIWESRIKPI